MQEPGLYLNCEPGTVRVFWFTTGCAESPRSLTLSLCAHFLGRRRATAFECWMSARRQLHLLTLAKFHEKQKQLLISETKMLFHVKQMAFEESAIRMETHSNVYDVRMDVP